jgi:arylsulfatase A-like enzyme
VAPDRQAQWARTPRLAEANATVAELLSSGGYETVALFNNPHHHPTSGFGQGFEHSRLLPRDSDQAYARVSSVADAFLDWHSERDPDRPYFAYLHLMDPHNPYRPPAEYAAMFPVQGGRYHYANGPAPADFDDHDLALMTALYDAEIRFLDHGLGRLIGELETRDGSGSTLVIVTADHGEELLDHGGLGHGKTVELEQLRIPLLMAGGPVAAATGQRIAPLVRNLDLAPTIVDAAALDAPAVFEGSSLLPLLADGSAEQQPRVAFAWIAELRSLTSTEWHCMRDLANDELTIYHRPSDPTGTIDVSADHPEVVELCVSEIDRLETERLASVARATELKAIETAAPASAEVREQLEALGYVE